MIPAASAACLMRRVSVPSAWQTGRRANSQTALQQPLCTNARSRFFAQHIVYATADCIPHCANYDHNFSQPIRVLIESSSVGSNPKENEFNEEATPHCRLRLFCHGWWGQCADSGSYRAASSTSRRSHSSTATNPPRLGLGARLQPLGRSPLRLGSWCLPASTPSRSHLGSRQVASRARRIRLAPRPLAAVDVRASCMGMVSAVADGQPMHKLRRLRAGGGCILPNNPHPSTAWRSRGAGTHTQSEPLSLNCSAVSLPPNRSNNFAA